jgi:Rrf2 family protein
MKQEVSRMQITQAMEYAVHGLVLLASQPEGEIVLASEVARQAEVSPSYMSKVFQQLAKAGLLVSHRGAKGGFSLAAKPKEITLLDVMEAVEGKLAISQCLLERATCPQEKTCPLKPVLKELQENMVSFLSQRTLAQLVAFKASRTEAKTSNIAPERSKR